MGVPPLPQDHESQCCLALSDCGSYSEEFVCATCWLALLCKLTQYKLPCPEKLLLGYCRSTEFKLACALQSAIVIHRFPRITMPHIKNEV